MLGVAHGEGRQELRGTSMGRGGPYTHFTGHKNSFIQHVPGRILSTLHALTHFTLTVRSVLTAFLIHR